jgi:hypothetical protein
MVFGMRLSVCLSVYMCALLAPERLDGFYFYHRSLSGQYELYSSKNRDLSNEPSKQKMTIFSKLALTILIKL